ncbi:Carbohydrate-binding protein, partial [Oryctes borbonicus]
NDQCVNTRMFSEVAGGFSCPAPGEVSNSGSLSRHAHPDDCLKYYICLKGVAREYGCPIGTVFKIGDAEGTGNCADPEDVPGCEDYYGDLDLKSIRKSELLAGLQSSSSRAAANAAPKGKPRPAPS